MAFWTEHPKWDQNPKFTPLNEHPRPFHMGVPPPGFSSAKREACTCFPPLSTNCTNPIFPRYKKKQQQKKKYIVTSTKVWKRILVRATCKIPYRPRNAACHPLHVLLQAFPCSYSPCIFFTGMHGNFIYTGYFLQVHLHSSTEKLTT